jgi:hypothetical protein
MPRPSALGTGCPECERLEAEFLDARTRLRHLRRLRRPTSIEEKALVDRVAMAIARAKEHASEHSEKDASQREREREAGRARESREKGIAAG